MALTPGILFLLAITPNLLLPLCVHVVLRYVANNYYSFHFYRPVIVLVWLVTLPVYWYIKASYAHFLRAWEARRAGAKLVPQISGKLPGNIDLLWKFFGQDIYLGDGIARAIDEVGTTFSMTILGDYRVVTANPHNTKQILATNFDNYEKGREVSKMGESVLGVGIFNSDGDMWQFHRRITRPFFAKERVTDFGIFDTKSKVALQKMQERFDAGEAIDFQDICGRFTIDSACAFLLGTPIDSLQDPLPRPGEHFSHIDTPSNRFARAFNAAQTSIAHRARVGTSWPLFEVLKDRTQDDVKIVRGFIEPIVREAMMKREAGIATQKEESLLEHLLNVTQDMKLIVDEIINILLAGRDTTASLLTFVAYCLAMHPQVLAHLREEIMSTVGTNRAPTFDDVRGMRYLRAVLNETLRLFPSVPFNNRYSIAPTTLHDDDGQALYVPAHTRIGFSSLHSQRHKPYWGEDAHLFDPDRFLDDRVRKYVTSNPFVFVPFNAGPRICLGQQFAYHETSFFIIRLLQRYDSITLAPECQPEDSRPPTSWKNSKSGTPRKAFEQIVFQSHLTSSSKGGLWLRMRTSKPIEEA